MFDSLDPLLAEKGWCVPPKGGRQLLLTELPVGSPGVVVEVGEGTHQARCSELGFIPGARVEVLRDGGETLLIAINDSRFAMSRACLRQIIVLPEATKGP